LVAQLAACSNTDQLPPDASVSVSPTTKTITLKAADPNQPTGCFVSPDTLYQDVPVQITVTNGQGSPLGDIEVGVLADFSGNTFSGPDVLQVFADFNGNGVVDVETELVSGPESGIYKTDTDEFHGTAMVIVRMNLTCPYNGELYVFAGANSATVDFEVQHESIETPGATTADSTTGGTTDGGNTDGGTTGDGSTDVGATDGSSTEGSTTGGTGSGDIAQSSFSGGQINGPMALFYPTQRNAESGW